MNPSNSVVGLCQYREDGQICIRTAGHEGEHVMAPDTATEAIIEAVRKHNGANPEFAERLSASLMRNKDILDKLALND